MAEIVMNPVRQRIFQYFLVHETGTVKQLRAALPDIPSASLYRHIKLLTDHAVLTVVGENRIRGTVECVYQLNRRALEIDDPDGAGVQMALLRISSSFAHYFSSGHADPRGDMLMLTTCTLMLTDDAFAAFLSEINQLAEKYMRAPMDQGCKPRQITLISSPADGQ